MNYFTGIAATLVLAAFAALGVDRVRLKNEVTKKDAAIATLVMDQGHDRARLEQYGRNETASAEAKAKTDAVVENLRKRLDKAAGVQRDTEALARAAEARARANAVAAQRARDELTKQRDDLYANDSTCDAWRRAPVCAAVSRGLRLEWDAARAIALRSDDGTNNRGGGPPAVPADAGASDHGSPAASAAVGYSWTDAIANAAVSRFTNGQMQNALSDALLGYTQAAGQLLEIKRMGEAAVEVTP